MNRRAKWYVPSFNGDLRLEPSADDKNKCTLSIVEPTIEEAQSCGAILQMLADRKFIERAPSEPIKDGERIAVNAPLEQIGPLVVSVLRPGPAVLTAIRMKDGRVEVCEHGEPGKGEPSTPEEKQKTTETALVKLADKPAEAAVTVKRPTPSCPDCFVQGAIRPATEVLLAFMTPEQHKTWSRGRYLVARGGITRHEYIIAHRHSEIAAKNSRICWDATDMDTMHFHDQSVPPEEEVLAAMLVLQHREDWLRNEATCLGPRFRKVLKNPFGGFLDGGEDAAMTKMFGIVAAAVTGADIDTI